MTNLTATIVFGILGLALFARAIQAQRQAEPEIEAGLLKMAICVFAVSAVSLVLSFV